MKILFVNIGPSILNSEGKLKTNVKFWLFFKHFKRYMDVEYMGPVKQDITSNMEYEVDVDYTPLPFFVSSKTFYKNLLNPIFVYKLFKTLYNYNWDKVDIIYLRDTHPLTLIIFMIGVIKKKKMVLHITGNPKKIAKVSFKGFKRSLYILYAHIREFLELLMSKKALILLSTEHNYLKINNKNVFPIRTSLISEKERVSEDFIEKKYNSSGIQNIVYVGRLSYEKGLDILIESIYKVNYHCDKYKLIIVGDGPEKNKLKFMAKQKLLTNKVEFMGNISNRNNLAKIIRNAYVFVIPSREDGLPKVLIEAMNLGVAIIGSNVGKIPEVLDEKCGLIFKKEDSNDLAEKILILIRDNEKAKKYALNALRKGKNYVIENEISRLFKIITKKTSN